MKICLTCLVLIGLTFQSVAADNCLGVPASLSKGSDCASGIPCAHGLYCDVTGTCSPQVALGANCNSAIAHMCPYSASCLGNQGSQICVQNASPGQTCAQISQALTSQTAQCGSNLYCNPDTNTCQLGQLGDNCINNADCESLLCTGNVCVGGAAVGASCLSSFCVMGSYCVDSSTSGTCTSYPNSGTCGSEGICAIGYQCAALSPTETPTCVANMSLPTGSYCGGVDSACQSGLCFENYCASKLPSVCYNNEQNPIDCGNGQICTCNGQSMLAGTGSCVTDPCYKTASNLVACYEQNCLGYSLPPNFLSASYVRSMTSYTGACMNNTCGALATAYVACSSASLLSASFSLVVLFSIFASIFKAF